MRFFTQNFNINVHMLVSRSQIVGGENTTIDDYPWAALLRYRHEKKQIESWGCGGAYVGGRTIVTAAHCVDAQAVNDLGELYVALPTMPDPIPISISGLFIPDYSFVLENTTPKMTRTALKSLDKWTAPILQSISKSHVGIPEIPFMAKCHSNDLHFDSSHFYSPWTKWTK